MPTYTVLLPAKSPALGKSRLRGLTDDYRRRLAAAFAHDTVTAALGSDLVDAVLAITDDFRFAEELSDRGCVTIPDSGEDLNAMLRVAAAEGRRRWPATRPVALCADLPALRSSDLDAALAAAAAHDAAFVADAAGTGTTMYAATYETFDPQFGPGSRAAHQRTGATEITGELPSLRQDVDDVGDLARAVALGVGTRTARVG